MCVLLFSRGRSKPLGIRCEEPAERLLRGRRRLGHLLPEQGSQGRPVPGRSATGALPQGPTQQALCHTQKCVQG